MDETSEIYLDNAATTKPCPEAVRAVVDALEHEYGNASSAHARGQAARRLLEDSRAVIAGILDVEPEEVYFTSGATEANNLALRGAAEARGVDAGAILASDLEHPSVTRTVRGLRRAGFTTRHIPAPNGELDIQALHTLLAEPVQLVSVMQVQNELGYIFPVDQVAQTVRELASEALVHTDATQAFGKLDVRPRAMGVDLLSCASHKICGPKGVGALYVRKGTSLFTTAFGGGQERGLRSGTEPVFLAAGFAVAARLAMQNRERSFAQAQALKARVLEQLRQRFENLVVLSRDDGSPYIVTVAIPGQDSEQTVRALSDRGVFVSRGSACSMSESMVPAGTWRPKHPQAYQAAGIPRELNDCMLRVSFAPTNTLEEVDGFVGALVAVLS